MRRGKEEQNKRLGEEGAGDELGIGRADEVEKGMGKGRNGATMGQGMIK